MSESKHMVRIYLRLKDWEGLSVYGTRAIKQWGEYILTLRGLKLVVVERPKGIYHVVEALSGYDIDWGTDRDKVISRSIKLIEGCDERIIQATKGMAKYYGMHAMHVGLLSIIRVNTLIGNKDYQRKYKNRIKDIRCKDCGCLYEKCIDRTARGEIRACCPDCHCGTRSRRLLE